MLMFSLFFFVKIVYDDARCLGWPVLEKTWEEMKLIERIFNAILEMFVFSVLNVSSLALDVLRGWIVFESIAHT